MEERIAQLEALVAELVEWKQAKTKQQIDYPLDAASKNSIGAVVGQGTGNTTLTRNISLSGDPESITVPASYTTSLIVEADGTRYELPAIATP